jgi:hypothetical protein
MTNKALFAPNKVKETVNKTAISAAKNTKQRDKMPGTEAGLANAVGICSETFRKAPIISCR